MMSNGMRVLLIFFMTNLSFVSYSTAQTSAPWVGETFEGVACKGDAPGYGPYDYTQRNALASKLDVVELYHFTPDVENLVGGKSGSLSGDLDYTLRAWPNHHRALNAMMRYQKSLDSGTRRRLAANGVPATECYLYRAINFSPSDATAKMLLGMLLHGNGQLDSAESVYREAIELQPNELQIQYNLGLLLVEKKDYDGARQLAKNVYQLDFPLPGLQNKLKRNGYWP